MKRIIVLIISVIIVACSSSLLITINIGVGAWDALAMTFSNLTKIEVGTLGIILNSSCVLLQIIILKKDFKVSNLLQIPISILLGVVVNFMVYNVYSNLSINNYIFKVILLVMGYIICAIAVASVMVLDIVTFALEGACMAISKKVNKEFHKIRQTVDIISILLVMIISIILSASLTFREGTVLGMLIFGPVMGSGMNMLRPMYKKIGLID